MLFAVLMRLQDTKIFKIRSECMCIQYSKVVKAWMIFVRNFQGQNSLSPCALAYVFTKQGKGSHTHLFMVHFFWSPKWFWTSNIGNFWMSKILIHKVCEVSKRQKKNTCNIHQERTYIRTVRFFFVCAYVNFFVLFESRNWLLVK